MAFKTMADNGINITAKQDGALYNALCHSANFVIEGIGQEFAYTVSGLNVTVGTGEAIIHGRHITAESSNTIKMPTYSSGYLVLRLDLSKTSGNEAYLYATPTITNEEVNWNGTIADMVIASFTSTLTKATLTDMRIKMGGLNGAVYFTVEQDGNVWAHYSFNGEIIGKKLGSVEGTATPSDVRKGATFMSALSDELQTGTMVTYATGSKTLAECISGGLTPCTVKLNADLKASASKSSAGTASGNTAFTCVSNGQTYTIMNVRTYYNGNSSGSCSGTVGSNEYIDVEHLGLSVCKNITSFSIDCTVTRWAIQ